MSTPAAAIPDEAKELALINKVELRIALTSSASTLQTLLGTYLPPLLLKLGSPHASVRNKIITLCQHLNTRIRSSDEIQLPVEKLLRQFKDPEVGGKWALVRNFDVMYIGLGVGRMGVEERVTLLPVLIEGIAGTPGNHQPQIFNILLEILPFYKPPARGTAEDAKLRAYFGFERCPEDELFLQRWFTRLMFLTYQTFGAPPNQTCRGLTPEEYSFLTLGGKRETWNPPATAGAGRPGAGVGGGGEKLRNAKVAALGFLATGAFTDEGRYLPALVAAAHSVTEDSRVVELGEEIVKRSGPGVPLDEDPVGFEGRGERTIEKLYELFFLGAEGRTVPPVRWSLRARIVSILAKSKKAVSGRFGAFVPRIVRVAVGDVAGGGGGGGGASAGDETVGWNDVERDIKKLRREAFVLVNWFARVADTPTVQAHGRTIFETLRLYIAGVKEQLLSNQSSYSASQGTIGGFDDARGQAYEAMGLLCRRLFRELVYVPDLDVLRFFFSSLRETGITATAEIRQSVEAALSSLLVGFSSLGAEYDEHVEDALAEFLVQEVEGEEAEMKAGSGGGGGMTKYVAVRFANRGLRFDNVKAKWICLLAAGSGGTAAGNSGRSEVVEEGRRGLDPYWYRMLNPAPHGIQEPVVKGDGDGDGDVDMGDDDAKRRRNKSKSRYTYPDFVELIQFITTPHYRLTEAGNRRTINNVPVEIYSLAVDFCKRILVTEATTVYNSSMKSKQLDSVAMGGVVDELDSQTFSTKLDTAITADATVRAAVADLISTYLYSASAAPEEAAAVHTLFTLAYDGMVKDIPTCAEVWVELCELAPQSLVAEWARSREKVLELRTMVVNGTFSSPTGGGSFGGNSDLDKRNLLVKALGSVVAHPECESGVLGGTVDGFVAMRKEGGYKAYTAIVGIGYLFGRLAVRGRLNGEEGVVGAEVREACVEIVREAVLAEGLVGAEKILTDAGLQAFSELCVFGVITKEKLGKEVRKKVFERLTKLAKSEGIEKAILAVGCYSLLFTPGSGKEEEDAEELAAVEKLLYDLHENRKLELSFAVGEAMTIYAAGWGCRSLVRRYLDIRGVEPPQEVVAKRKDETLLLKKTVDKVLDEYSRSTKPSLRRGACVWLLSLIEGCGEAEVIVGRLKDAQAAFRGFLVDRDEFVQETASRGLTLVYEKGDKEMKDELVRSLIASFTGDTKAQTLAGQVSADTQLFEPGTLQTGTSDHGSISTYKDIMSLASEVGDPSLIYRFMSLAKHNSLWASRASFGRYGLGSILSNSSTSVDGYLTENPKLYPKLYRYRFDPNPNVRKSMNDIWSAMVKDSQGTLDKYFDDILTDLLKTILDREWRVREASCGALGDLLQGREVSRYAMYLERIWGVAFKVMDDIKESVRIAALTLCRVLATSMVRVVSVDSGASQKDAEMVLGNLMPFLLGIQGLEAQAKEVQIFALDTLMKLIKNAGKTLKGYIPELVEKLLGLLSTLEHQAINYLHLNAAKYNLTEEKIDAARLSGVRSSPLMDAIERCLDLLDEPTMAKLVPHLIRTVKKAVGMPSKVGSSRVIVTLVVRHHFLTKPHADELLRAVMAVTLDRNDAVSTSWAVAAGYLCRLCGEQQVLALVGLARKMWFEHEEDRARALAGEIIHDISRHSTDKFNSLSSSILPFVYLAKHDTSSTTVSTVFTNVWTENTGGTGAIKLHLSEIVTLAQENLASNRWAVKQASATTLADVCSSLGKDVSKEQIEVIYPAMVKATDGKSWEGKEKAVEGFVELVGNFPKNGDAVWGKRLLEAKKIVVREAKRNNKPYQAKAIKSLAKFVEVVGCRGIDMFADVEAIVESALEEEDDGDSTGGNGGGGGGAKDAGGDADRMDVDDSEGRSLRSVRLTAYLNSLAAVAHTFGFLKDKLTSTTTTTTPTTGLSPKDLQHRKDVFLNLLTKPPRSLATVLSAYAPKLEQVDATGVFLGNVVVVKKEGAGAGAVGLGLGLAERDLLSLWDWVRPHLEDRGSEELRLRCAKGVVGRLVEGVVGLGAGDGIREKVRAGLKTLVDGERSKSVREVLEGERGRLV